MEIKEILKKMSPEDKIRLLSGADFWSTKAFEKYGIPSFFMCDGPSGLRKQERENGADMLGVYDSRKATCFPSAVTASNTWNEELLYELGKAIGEEARDQKVGMVLGPGINIKRNPLCGRNFEYYSEDPVQAGELSAQFVKGLQSQGVAACMKHFACNSQEKSRFTSNSVVDERTLREIYLKGFEIAVKKAKPMAIMSAYPRLNGVHCSDNKKLLDEILRKEWDFDGMVVTDWGGMNDCIAAIKAGNDLSMPGGSDYMEKEMLEALKDGTLKEEELDRCCERIISLALKQDALLKEDCQADYPAHHRLAVKIAQEGAVLLKNEKGLLPLKKEDKVLIVGAMAEKVRYQGAGSSHINPMDLRQPLEYFENCEYLKVCDEYGTADKEELKKLEESGRDYQAIIVFAGLPDRYESEGFDRDDLKMPEGHVEMIETAAGANANTIVVLCCGGVVECGWADDVSSILYMGLSGEGTAEAAHDLIYGLAAPSGKLSESWPYRYEDVVSSHYYGKSRDALYMEGIYVGYRYYDKADIAVRFPYGYGLNYSTFSYENITVEGKKVTVQIVNTGDHDAAEVVQLYIVQKDPTMHRPVKELKHFTKVFLKKGERKEVVFELEDEDFMLWDDGFRKVKGTYEVMIGRNSRDIVFAEEIDVDGETIEAPAWQKGSFYEGCKEKPVQEEWEKLSGVHYEPDKLVKGSFTMENTVEEMKDYSLVMKIMYKAVEKTIAKGFGGKVDYDDPEFRMLMNSSAGSPLRSMKISGGMKGGALEGMLEMANGHFIRGIRRMIAG